MAVMAPENVGHLHCWTVGLAREASHDEVLAALGRNTRIAFIRASQGVTALNVTTDLMLERERPCGAMWEVALWDDIRMGEGRGACYAYQVDNRAIVIPENMMRFAHSRDANGVGRLLWNKRIAVLASGSGSCEARRSEGRSRRQTGGGTHVFKVK